jgi:hypothetical protein
LSLRFYAAAPLQTTEEYNLGTLCIIDKATRAFSEKEKKFYSNGFHCNDEMEMWLALRNALLP